MHFCGITYRLLLEMPFGLHKLCVTKEAEIFYVYTSTSTQCICVIIIIITLVIFIIIIITPYTHALANQPFIAWWTCKYIFEGWIIHKRFTFISHKLHGNWMWSDSVLASFLKYPSRLIANQQLGIVHENDNNFLFLNNSTYLCKIYQLFLQLCKDQTYI